MARNKEIKLFSDPSSPIIQIPDSIDLEQLVIPVEQGSKIICEMSPGDVKIDEFVTLLSEMSKHGYSKFEIYTNFGGVLSLEFIRSIE